MKLLLRNKTFHLHRRVPRRFRDIEPREHVTISLHTDSEKDAQIKAQIAWNEMLEGWELKLEGASAEGAKRLELAKRLAGRRGKTYFPSHVVATLPVAEIVERAKMLIDGGDQIDHLEAEALIGGVPQSGKSITEAFDEYWKVEKQKAFGKSPDQIRRWRNPRIKAIRNFTDLVSDKPYLDVTTADLYKFRAWWVDRMEKEGLTANSVNKDLVYVTSTLRAVARSEGESVKFSTEKLTIKEGEAGTRPPFSAKWIKEKLLAPGALDGLNPEARGILLGMINTGYRPSEGAALTADQIVLAGTVPYISIEPVGRQLKSESAKRKIPLTGVSLEAFKAFPKGFPRYQHNSATLSATVNKFLAENGLLETSDHSLYSLRHGFEDRMLRAGFDERIRRDLMGHALDREKYGDGGGLRHVHRLLKKIAL